MSFGSYPDTEYPRVNEGMYSPQISQGVVLVKGKMDTLLYAVATQDSGLYDYGGDCTPPCYKMPKNCPTPNLQCRNRAIAFQKIPDSGVDFSEVMNLYTPDDYGESGVPVMTSLYGQGEKNNRFDLYNRIKPFGIIWNGNEDNYTDKFNVQVGGTIQVSNNGPHRINAGDIIYADLPEVEPNNYEKGRKELIFKVYSSEHHKSNNMGIRKCLDVIDDSNYKGYHQRFKELSEELMELKVKNHFIQTYLFGQYMLSQHDHASLVNLNRDFDVTVGTPAFDYNKFKSSALYELYKNFHFPKKDTNLIIDNVDKKNNHDLNVFIKETYDRIHSIKAEFLKFQLDWIMGKAVTSANPGEDFVLMLTNFSL